MAVKKSVLPAVLLTVVAALLSGCTADPCKPYTALVAGATVGEGVPDYRVAALATATYLYCAEAVKEEHKQAFGYTPAQDRKEKEN